jgi:tRNA nucleotidyltransferase (CCA-adding enzyme)
VDLAATRTETYPEPGALPRVAPGTLTQDLFRRDFTVNTLALPLGEDRRIGLVDLFGGWRDLQRRTLCILHRRSFLDDPTRAYRAVRLAARRALTLDRTTERCLRDSIRRGAVQRVSGVRLYRELRAVLDHPRPARTLALLHRQGLLAAADPALAWGRRVDRRVRRLEGILRWYERPGRPTPPRRAVLLLMALTEGRDARGRRALAEQFALTGRERDLLVENDVPLRRLIRRLGRRDRLPGPAAIFFACQDQLVELLLFALAKTGRRMVRRAIVRYLDHLAGTALDINGGDLVRAGVPPGPELGRILRRTLAARLEGRIRGGREELGFALRLARRGRRGAGRVATVDDARA